MDDSNGLVTAFRIGDTYKSSPLEFDIDLKDGSSQHVRIVRPIKFSAIMLLRSEVASIAYVRFQGRLSNGDLMPEVHTREIELKGGVTSEHAGAMVVIEVSLDGRVAGQIWFEIFVNDELATKVPLFVIQIQGTSGAPRAEITPNPIDLNHPQKS